MTATSRTAVVIDAATPAIRGAAASACPPALMADLAKNRLPETGLHPDCLAGGVTFVDARVSSACRVTAGTGRVSGP